MHTRTWPAIVGIGAILGCPAAWADIMFQVQPPSQSVALGSVANVGVQISGLGAFTTPSLGAYDFSVSFDPLLLQFLSATFGDPALGDQLDLAGFGSIQSVSPNAISVELFELSLDSIDDLNNLQAPSFVVGTLNFQAIGLGTSSINISVNALSDAYGDALAAGVQNGSVTVNAVPEPGSLLLLGIFVTLLTLQRRFRHLMRGRT